MSFKKLEIIEFGDVHLFHPKTTTAHISRAVRVLLPDNESMRSVDLLIINGDLWDREISFSDPNVQIGQSLVGYIIYICTKYDIVLRVTEGTPSHDWRQSKEFLVQKELGGFDVDLEYVDTLSIEYIQKLGITVLYVPDEWRHTCSETWEEIMVLMRQKNLEQVDFSVVHGIFPHQMPENLHGLMDMHDPEKFLTITKYYVFAAHVHTHAIYDRIVGAGSTDRLCHGEEGPKGIIRMVVQESGAADIKFIENQLAKKYITVECHNLDNDQALETIKEAVRKLPDDSHVRIKAHKTDAAVTGFKAFEALFPQFNWTLKTEDSKTEKAIKLEDARFQLSTISITRENLKPLLMKRIQAKYPELANDCERMFEGVINGNGRSSSS